MLDTRKFPCPEPDFMVRLALRKLKDGDTLCILEDSPCCIKSLERMCFMLDHQLVSKKLTIKGTILTIMKGLGTALS